MWYDLQEINFLGCRAKGQYGKGTSRKRTYSEHTGKGNNGGKDKIPLSGRFHQKKFCKNMMTCMEFEWFLCVIVVYCYCFHHFISSSSSNTLFHHFILISSSSSKLFYLHSKCCHFPSPSSKSSFPPLPSPLPLRGCSEQHRTTNNQSNHKMKTRN